MQKIESSETLTYQINRIKNEIIQQQSAKKEREKSCEKTAHRRMTLDPPIIKMPYFENNKKECTKPLTDNQFSSKIKFQKNQSKTDRSLPIVTEDSYDYTNNKPYLQAPLPIYFEDGLSQQTVENNNYKKPKDLSNQAVNQIKRIYIAKDIVHMQSLLEDQFVNYVSTSDSGNQKSDKKKNNHLSKLTNSADTNIKIFKSYTEPNYNEDGSMERINQKEEIDKNLVPSFQSQSQQDHQQQSQISYRIDTENAENMNEFDSDTTQRLRTQTSVMESKMMGKFTLNEFSSMKYQPKKSKNSQRSGYNRFKDQDSENVFEKNGKFKKIINSSQVCLDSKTDRMYSPVIRTITEERNFNPLVPKTTRKYQINNNTSLPQATDFINKKGFDEAKSSSTLNNLYNDNQNLILDNFNNNNHRKRIIIQEKSIGSEIEKKNIFYKNLEQDELPKNKNVVHFEHEDNYQNNAYKKSTESNIFRIAMNVNKGDLTHTLENFDDSDYQDGQTDNLGDCVKYLSKIGRDITPAHKSLLHIPLQKLFLKKEIDTNQNQYDWAKRYLRQGEMLKSFKANYVTHKKNNLSNETDAYKKSVSKLEYDLDEEADNPLGKHVLAKFPDLVHNILNSQEKFQSKKHDKNCVDQKDVLENLNEWDNKIRDNLLRKKAKIKKIYDEVSKSIQLQKNTVGKIGVDLRIVPKEEGYRENHKKLKVLNPVLQKPKIFYPIEQSRAAQFSSKNNSFTNSPNNIRSQLTVDIPNPISPKANPISPRANPISPKANPISHQGSPLSPNHANLLVAMPMIMHLVPKSNSKKKLSTIKPKRMSMVKKSSFVDEISKIEMQEYDYPKLFADKLDKQVTPKFIPMGIEEMAKEDRLENQRMKNELENQFKLRVLGYKQLASSLNKEKLGTSIVGAELFKLIEKKTPNLIERHIRDHPFSFYHTNAVFLFIL